MKLAQGHDRKVGTAGDRFSQPAAVLHHCFAGVFFRGPEIQFAWSIFSTVDATQAAPSRAESMQQPGGFSRPGLLPARNLQELHTICSYSRYRGGAGKLPLGGRVFAL